MENEFRYTKDKPSLVCKHCGEEIRHFLGNLYHTNSPIFPQYCRNTVNPDGTTKYGGLHEPILDKEG